MASVMSGPCCGCCSMFGWADGAHAAVAGGMGRPLVVLPLRPLLLLLVTGSTADGSIVV